MKFATQISPLINSYITKTQLEKIEVMQWTATGNFQREKQKNQKTNVTIM